MNSQTPRQLNEVYSIYDDALLGKGSTGNVYLGCANSNPNHKVAIKSINLNEINNQVTRYLLSCEIAALSNLGKLQNTQHDNIVRLLQIIILDNHIYLVMELLQGGTLADYIKKHPNGLPQQEALFILKQILEGYKRIKDKHIVHRDLKPDNILFKSTPNQSKTVAIIDFGYCEMREVPNKPQMFYNVGSPKYMSPQAYKENKYSQKSDIWAIGVMLYEMLIGKTCDNGMTMQSYLEMLKTTGIPLPGNLKNIHKHLLTCMLAYNHESRIQCDQALRVLNLQQNHMTRPSTQVSLPIKMGQDNLRATLDINPSERPNRNNPIFYSAFLPGQISPNINSYQSQEPFQAMSLQRNQSGMSQPTEELHKMREVMRFPATSFYNQSRNFNRVVLPPRTNKPQNTQFYSAKQIIHRKLPGNTLIQLKNSNMSPFRKHHTQFLERQTPQNFGLTLNAPRIAMNQIVNQDIKVNAPHSQIIASAFNTPKQQITFSKTLSQTTPQQVHVLQLNNTPKVHTSQFDIGRIREVQNIGEPPQLKKHISQDVRFVGLNHFQQNNQNHRQSEQLSRPQFLQNKIHINLQHQNRVNNDLTLTRHPFPHLAQSVIPRQDLTMTRVPQYQNHHQNVIHNSDLTQTRIPIQIVHNDLAVNRAPRVSQDLNMIHKQIIRQQPTQGFDHKNHYISERVIVDKIPNKHVDIVREVVSLKPQVSAIRNIGKIQRVNLNSYHEGFQRQQPHSVLIRQGIVK